MSSKLLVSKALYSLFFRQVEHELLLFNIKQAMSLLYLGTGKREVLLRSRPNSLWYMNRSQPFLRCFVL